MSPPFEGWLYLTVIMDPYSRQIVGWAVNKRMKKELVLKALSMANWQRKPDKGLVHHSDRESQYACHEYRKQLQIYGMTAFMSCKGNCWDNAPTERFFRSLKSERLTACRFLTRKDAMNEILDCITYYNSIRLHSTLGYLSPMEYEKEQYLKAA
jgi:transposase InsO family protein